MRVLASGYQQPQDNNNGARPAPPAPRFMIVLGQPKTIALKYPTGKPVRSRINGQMQMMYTLTSGERAFFDLPVAEAIDSLTLAPGQPFTICHHGGGNWDVDRAVQQRTEDRGQRTASAAPGAPPVDDAPPAVAHNQKMNGAGETAADLYLQHFQQAIDIVLAGVPMAGAKGLMVAPSFEDIRAIATHLSISREQRQ